MNLENGIHFRVCNVCSKRLPTDLNDQHSKHLKLHQPQWNHYLVMMAKALKNYEAKKPKDIFRHIPAEKQNEDEELSSSSESEEDVFNVLNAVDCLQYSGQKPPRLTTFEHILMRKYTYDKNPIRKFREITDWKVAKHCNILKFNQIVDEMGDGIYSGYLNPQQLYSPNSKLVNKIMRLLCPKQCYYLPSECFFGDSHEANFKQLLKKELHDKMNPHFKNLMTKDAGKLPILQYNEYHQPKTYDLCVDVGITTKLEYNEEGFLDLNYDLFCKQLWDNETPLFILEENKVLDTILCLVLSASEKYSALRSGIALQYSQAVPGLNPPVLSLMMHGPDLQKFSGSAQACEMLRDERNCYLKEVVTHTKCRSMKNEHHWMFKHHPVSEKHIEESSLGTDMTRQGPASLPDQSIVYPCNLGHWHACQCGSCCLVRQIKCNSHKKHLQFNLETCSIKEAVSCTDHKIDHPENVQPDDIIIQKHILHHNGDILKNGRNYQVEEITLAGLKNICICCRRNTEDHFNHHLSPHPQCELCVFETKTLTDKDFWKKVCSVCGKKFEDERLKVIHKKKHEVPKETCDICEETFSSKFNFQRHLVEMHNVFLQANNGPVDGTEEEENYKFTCNYCQKDFKYERNVVAHIEKVHYGRDECECNICGLKFTRGYNLKSHLAEQHSVLNVGLSLHRESPRVYSCAICAKEFLRKNNLTQHEKVHKEQKEIHSCDICKQTFTYKSTLTRHKRTKHGDEAEFSCSVCEQNFDSLWNLSEHFKTHSESRQMFDCTLCDRSYLSQWNLKRHYKLKH